MRRSSLVALAANLVIFAIWEIVVTKDIMIGMDTVECVVFIFAIISLVTPLEGNQHMMFP